VYLFSIDVTKCERCFDCVTSCPRGVFEEGELHPILAHPEECIGCGICLALCRPKGLRIAGLEAYGRADRMVAIA